MHDAAAMTLVHPLKLKFVYLKDCNHWFRITLFASSPSSKNIIGSSDI